MMASVEGLVMVGERRTTLRFSWRAVFSEAVMYRSISSQVAGWPCQTGPRRRASSYRESTVAWPVAQVPPPNSLDSALPSILIGRPSRCLTSRLHDEAQPLQVVAK